MATTKKGKKSERYVIIRTYSAGVHIGVLVSRKGKEAQLTNARRIWSWQGANTLHEISLRGVAPGSRISEPVKDIELTEVIEVITATPEARAILESVGWAK